MKSVMALTMISLTVLINPGVSIKCYDCLSPREPNEVDNCNDPINKVVSIFEYSEEEVCTQAIIKNRWINQTTRLSLGKKAADAILNGTRTTIYGQEVIPGTFSYCDTDKCNNASISNGTLKCYKCGTINFPNKVDTCNDPFSQDISLLDYCQEEGDVCAKAIVEDDWINSTTRVCMKKEKANAILNGTMTTLFGEKIIPGTFSYCETDGCNGGSITNGTTLQCYKCGDLWISSRGADCIDPFYKDPSLLDHCQEYDDVCAKVLVKEIQTKMLRICLKKEEAKAILNGTKTKLHNTDVVPGTFSYCDTNGCNGD